MLGMGERNDEGQAVVDVAKRMELVISNTLRKNWDIRSRTAVEDVIHK